MKTREAFAFGLGAGAGFAIARLLFAAGSAIGSVLAFRWFARTRRKA